jgi:integrase
LNDQHLESEAYKNFIASVDSEATRLDYRNTLGYFMKYCKLETYDSLLSLASETRKLEGIIRDYIITLKERKLSSSTISAYTNAVSQFYQMNDIVLNWKKLGKYRGRKRSTVDDRPYNRTQIRRLLDFASLRLRCAILLMSSAGLRKGAIPFLKRGDLEKIEKYQLYKIKVYKKEQEQYTTFCSPECAKALEEYFRYRERMGEVLTAKSPVLRKEFNIESHMKIVKAQPVGIEAISWQINTLLDRSGVRARSNSPGRTELMQCHGFRKFFMTTAMNAGINPVYCEYLMGHKTGLTKSYFKPSDNELLEGNDKAIGYIGVVDDLTINEENRLLKKVDDLRVKKDQIELMETKHQEEIKAMHDQMNQIMKLIRQNPKLAKIKPEALVRKKV